MNNSQYSSPGFVYFPTSTTPTKNAEETSDYIGFSESPQNQFKPDNYSSPQGCRTSQDYNSPQNHRQRFDRRRTPMQKNQWRHNRNSDSFNQSCNVSNNSFGNNSPRNGSYNRNRKVSLQVHFVMVNFEGFFCRASLETREIAASIHRLIARRGVLTITIRLVMSQCYWTGCESIVVFRVSTQMSFCIRHLLKTHGRHLRKS